MNGFNNAITFFKLEEKTKTVNDPPPSLHTLSYLVFALSKTDEYINSFSTRFRQNPKYLRKTNKIENFEI